jgi:Arc/MetJ-type ribon-helix-helix transcriptional regulator
MNVTLSASLSKQIEQELATGRYQSSDDLFEQAVRYFLDDRARPEAARFPSKDRSGR